MLVCGDVAILDNDLVAAIRLNVEGFGSFILLRDAWEVSQILNRIWSLADTLIWKLAVTDALLSFQIVQAVEDYRSI